MNSKKAITIGIIGLFILASLTSIAAANPGNDFSSDNQVIKQREIKVEDTQSTPFDMFIPDSISWWSPPPAEWDCAGVLCWQIKIDYQGDYNPKGTYHTEIKVYGIYTNHEELLASQPDGYGGSILPGLVWTRSSGPMQEKPDSLRVEFVTDYPGEDSSNNEKIVDVTLGVTIEGRAYEKKCLRQKPRLTMDMYVV